jgi:hypothetical protein
MYEYIYMCVCVCVCVCVYVTRYSSNIDQIPREIIELGGKTVRSEIPNIITSVWGKQKLPQQWKKWVFFFFFTAMNEQNPRTCS